MVGVLTWAEAKRQPYTGECDYPPGTQSKTMWAGLLLWVVVGSVGCIEVGWTDTIECVNVTMTSLPGSESAFETVRGFCIDDPECKELFGQSVGPQPDLFSALLEKTLLGGIPAYVESPVFDEVCGKTLGEVLERLWKLEAKEGNHAHKKACGRGQEKIVDETTGKIKCEAIAGRHGRLTIGDDNVIRALLILLFVAFVILVVVGLYHANVRRRLLRTIRAQMAAGK